MFVILTIRPKHESMTMPLRVDLTPEGHLCTSCKSILACICVLCSFRSSWLFIISCQVINISQCDTTGNRYNDNNETELAPIVTSLTGCSLM